MANTTVKCIFCGEQVDKDKAIKYNSTRYVCSDECKKRQSNKDKYKAPNVEWSDRRKLTDYMVDIFLDNGYEKHQINWELQMSQLKNIMAEHTDWTYAQIKYVLYYMYEVKQSDLFDDRSHGSILSLVALNFNEARDFAINCKNVKDALKDFEFDDNIIKINKTSAKRYYNDIDIESL